jgi:hypothetical protein
MNDDEQLIALADELDKLIHRFSIEFELPYALVIGAMQMYLLCREAEES